MTSQQKPRILVSNDDGIHAPGICALAQTLTEIAEVHVVAPTRERSGQSHGVTTTRPLRVVELESTSKVTRMIEVDGKPADCVKYAVTSIEGFKPDLVVSGINRGGNMGEDTLYSGTVGAAMEAVFYGFPAMAFSMHDFETWHLSEAMYLEAAKTALDLVNRFIKYPWSDRKVQCLNVNIPALPYDELKGIQHANVGKRIFKEHFWKKTDPRGSDYHWLDHGPHRFVDGLESDAESVRNGYVAVTPLQPCLQASGLKDVVNNWLQS